MSPFICQINISHLFFTLAFVLKAILITSRLRIVLKTSLSPDSWKQSFLEGEAEVGVVRRAGPTKVRV